jgi:hypothetical protein
VESGRAACAGGAARQSAATQAKPTNNAAIRAAGRAPIRIMR